MVHVISNPLRDCKDRKKKISPFYLHIKGCPAVITNCVCMHAQSCLFVTPLTTAHWAPISMGFPRQEYRSVLSFPPPGDLPNPRIKPRILVSPALAGGFFTTSATRETM